MSMLLFDKCVTSPTYWNTTDPQGTDSAVPAGGGAGKNTCPLNKWSCAYAHANPVSGQAPTCPESILDFDSDHEIYDFNWDEGLSHLEEEKKYEAGKETLQLENNSAPAAVYDDGVRDEEEGRKSDSPEKVFAADGKKVAEGFIHGQVTKERSFKANDGYRAESGAIWDFPTDVANFY
ncbi:hypothetical protein BDK51DRAFT_26090 [Blyttiomyces helicus]|uniref:Uncharacterized protein n=1 Tax=Blyttiomyces helicus TaxID=388810 RepID=A0A4P9WS54_9FUNG|nr:hypothetical protein BDK51DRAFT_26090 [Blyttiomyces helicus]|eukprot:RKO93806.1 hypothetical protein BDK51DRAFT_26090 [Blyttiomyces helicus]